jgi:hypothetical protein
LGAAIAAAQGAPVRFVQANDGTLYLVKDGARYQIVVETIDDDELAGYADGGPLGSSQVLATLGVPYDPSAVVRGAPPATTPLNADQATTPVDVDQTAAPQTPVARPSAAGVTPVDQGAQPAQQPAALAKGATRGGVPALSFTRVQGAAPGATALVTILTTPATSCSLTYQTPAGTRSTAAGLGAQTTDANGAATWSFTIDGNEKTGLGTLTVTCGNQVMTSTIQIGASGTTRR